MPLPGGAADKFGNRYEGRWTVYYMSQMLNEKVATITLEQPGLLGEGAEFVLTGNDGTAEFHQVKRQNGSQGPWSISALASAGVLATFKSKCSDSTSRCVFVSTSSADMLRELCERAQSADNLQQFSREFIKAQDLASNFAVLCQKWESCTEEDAYRMLRQIRVETIAESMLEREVAFRLETLVDGTSEAASDVLAQLVLDSVHHTLHAQDIWQRLHERGIRRRVWGNDPHVLVAVQSATERYLQPIRDRDILGQPIPRTEAQTVVSKLLASGGKRAVLISGNAGTGKTRVGAEVLERIQSLGWSTLALRLDRLEPAATPRQLGLQMDLPGSPATVLANISHGRDCLLFIDQLDAVSTTSGRNPQFYECVDEIIRQCAIHPNLRLMISCRRFDLANDDRLRRLVGDHGIADEVQVLGLTTDQVRRCVEACGVSAIRLTQKQLALLAVPLHLKIFTEIQSRREEETEEIFRFDTLKDLYDRYWDFKHWAVKERLGYDPKWGTAFDLFFQRTTREQSLSAPVIQLDDLASDRAALVSEGVFVQEGTRLSFFHETFFDYAFARRFIAGGKSLPEFLRSGEQHLFLRATVRQILSHERDQDFSAYLDDLHEVLVADNIRFHLKKFIFQWLRDLPNPSLEEWEIVRELIASPVPNVIDHVWIVVFSGSWFSLLDGAGFIQMELDSGDNRRIERIVNYLAAIINEAPERVVEITQSFIALPAPWPQYAVSILSRADGEKSRAFIDLYLKLVQADILQETDGPLSSSSHSLLLYDLPEKQPLWSLDALEAWLMQRIRMNEAVEETNPFKGETYGNEGNSLQKLAAAVPIAFVERLLPIVLELVRRNAVRVGPPPWKDRIWSDCHYGPHYAFHEQLLEELVSALKWMAQYEAEACLGHAEIIQQFLDFSTAGWILARTYMANGEQFAEKSAEFLLSKQDWLDLGWTDSSHWISRQLLEAVTPYCVLETVKHLEMAVLNYYSLWERKNLRWLGFGQLTLLHGFHKGSRSLAVSRRIGELQRKLGVQDGDPPRGIQVGSVGPPFNASWERLKDDDWLRATAKYDGEHSRHDLSRDFLAGGARELASVLKEQAKQEPTRFAELLLRFSTKTSAVYFTYILWGLSEAKKVDSELIWAVLQRCHSLPSRPCGDFISNLLCTYADEDIPLEILELVSWYALEAPSPEGDIWKSKVEGGQGFYGGDPESAGLNSVRGGMARAVGNLLFAQPARLDYFRTSLQRMVSDGSLAVRSQVAYSLLPVLNIDRTFAVELFLKLCDEQNDCLLGTHHVFEFLRYACYTHLSQLMGLLERMLRSTNDKAVHAGAVLVSMSALSTIEAQGMADACLVGSEAMRKAAAEVAAANIAQASNRDRCIVSLKTLFDDQAKSVREAAGRCFETLRRDDLNSFPDLIQSFISSMAFQDNSFWFFRALKETTAPLPDSVCLACERTAELLKKSVPGEGQGQGRSGTESSAILLRLYERSKSPAIKRRCLNIIDQTLMYDIYGLEYALSEREN